MSPIEAKKFVINGGKIYQKFWVNDKYIYYKFPNFYFSDNSIIKDDIFFIYLEWFEYKEPDMLFFAARCESECLNKKDIK